MGPILIAPEPQELLDTLPVSFDTKVISDEPRRQLCQPHRCTTAADDYSTDQTASTACRQSHCGSWTPYKSQHHLQLYTVS